MPLGTMYEMQVLVERYDLLIHTLGMHWGCNVAPEQGLGGRKRPPERGLIYFASDNRRTQQGDREEAHFCHYFPSGCRKDDLDGKALALRRGHTSRGFHQI